MNEILFEAFDQCLRDMENGASLEECLRKYPQLADELRPRLQALTQTKTYVRGINPPAGFQSASRDRYLALVNNLQSVKPAETNPKMNGNHHQSTAPAQVNPLSFSLAGFINWLLRPLANTAIRMAVILLVLVVAGAGVLDASAQSLPGTPFYGIKRSIETAQLTLAPDHTTKAQLESHFRERRMQELQEVTNRKLSVSVEFGGQLTRIDRQEWSIDGITVILPEYVQIKGSPGDGLYVWVKGQTQADGSVLANEVSINGLRFSGQVVRIQVGVWRVDQQDIYISSDTHIRDNPQVGDTVEVNVWILPDGSWLAEQINVESSHSDDPNGQENKESGKDQGNEPTGLPGSEDRSGKKDSTSPQPTTGNSNEGGHGPGSSETPRVNSGSGEVGQPANTPEPSRAPEPARTLEATKTSQPTRTPNPSGGNLAPTPAPSQEVRVTGVLQSINGNTWVVAEQAFIVTGSTTIDNNPQVNDTVEVRANAMPDGSLVAMRITKKN